MRAVVQSYTGITATGAKPAIAAPAAVSTFALQVAIPSGAITSWSVNLEGSIDGQNWTTLLTHAAAIGSTQWVVGKPVIWVRANVTALILNTAPSITVTLVGIP